MTNQHPITPPPELVQQWASKNFASQHLCTQAARWGADMELEACCMWITREKSVLIAEELGIARRPKPPSLKEQALNLLNNHKNGWAPLPKQWQIIRLAVEALSE